jgi:serine/threonine protein kinase
MNNKDKIGSGAFGEVYRGYHAKTKVKLAFKMELSTTTTPQLPIEYKVLKLMQGYRK